MDTMEKIAYFHNWWNGVAKVKASLRKDENPLRIGVLGAAAINFLAIIDPIQTHLGAVLAGIAARDISKAQTQIQKYNLGTQTKAYGSYDSLLDDPNIQAVYIPLPNSLHAEWAIKAMHKGKHVLIEKPIASNAAQAREIREVSEKTGKIALEAFHWRFHPAPQVVREMVQSGKYGRLLNIEARLLIPSGAMKKDDIRFQYPLAGGSIMDLTYVFSACQFFTSPASPSTFQIHTAHPRLCPTDPLVDEAMEATFTTADNVHCTIKPDLALPPLFNFIPRFWSAGPHLRLELEKATIELSNFVAPAYRHSVTVTDKQTGRKEVKSFYKGGQRGEDWWTTYRWQLEAFVDAVRAKEEGREYEGAWMKLEESEQLMQMIDAVYEKAGLPKRGL